MKKVLLGIVVISLIAVSCSKDTPGGGGGGTTPTPTAKTPGKAVLTSPANNKTCEEVNTSGQVTFSWNASTDTDKYDLKITNLNTQGVNNQNNITTTSKAVTLTKGIPYSWSITSKNEGTKTTTSDTWQFYLAGDGVVNYAPFPATAVSPSPGASVARTSGKVTIEWSGSDADDDSFDLYLRNGYHRRYSRNSDCRGHQCIKCGSKRRSRYGLLLESDLFRWTKHFDEYRLYL